MAPAVCQWLGAVLQTLKRGMLITPCWQQCRFFKDAVFPGGVLTEVMKKSRTHFWKGCSYLYKKQQHVAILHKN
jgi:hypothetical protein